MVGCKKHEKIEKVTGSERDLSRLPRHLQFPQPQINAMAIQANSYLLTSPRSRFGPILTHRPVHDCIQ